MIKKRDGKSYVTGSIDIDGDVYADEEVFDYSDEIKEIELELRLRKIESK